MDILENKAGIQYSEVVDLMDNIGWGRDVYRSEAIFKYAIEKTSYLAYIRDQNRLVGYGRVVEDGIHCMFYDICIHLDYRKKGLGSQIMNHLIGKLNENQYFSMGLFCEEGNPTLEIFYNKLGFEIVPAMHLNKLCRK